MRLVLLGDCAFGLGPFHRHSGDPIMINFGFMRAKLDSVGSLAGGCAGITTPDTLFCILGGTSNALRAHVRNMVTDSFLDELAQDLTYLVDQFSFWGLNDQTILFNCLPVNDAMCRDNNVTVSNRYIDTVNKALTYIASDRNLPLLDLSTNLTDNHGQLAGDLSTDGLHLNSSGYEILEVNLLASLDSHLQKGNQA